MHTITDRWWDNTDRGKPKYWEKNLSKCHFPQQISHKLAWDRT